jgi:xanthine phosphoribosyltransferase
MQVLDSSREIKEIQEAILKKGSVLGGGILKVDSFLNHQIDPRIMRIVGNLVYQSFKDQSITKVITVESSGIAPAFASAESLNVPLIFARKKKPVTMKEFITESAPSHTKGGIVELNVSLEFLGESDRVIIVDDFLASGQTIAALARIVERAGATLCGFATVIEKTFEDGRRLLEGFGVPVIGIVKISSLEPLEFSE